jgi:hypothetical protein
MACLSHEVHTLSSTNAPNDQQLAVSKHDRLLTDLRDRVLTDLRIKSCLARTSTMVILSEKEGRKMGVPAIAERHLMPWFSARNAYMALKLTLQRDVSCALICE